MLNRVRHEEAEQIRMNTRLLNFAEEGESEGNERRELELRVNWKQRVSGSGAVWFSV